MVFSSLFLDPPNWNNQILSSHQEILCDENPQLPPPPPPHGGGGSIRAGSMADRARLAKILVPETAQKCPRCDSSNTKFCYFNNYSLSQPRHFCKTCRRYWTRGGALRNVPVGRGCRRNKKSKNSRPSKSPASTDRQTKPSSAGAISTGWTAEITPSFMPPAPQNLSQYGGFGGIQMGSLGTGGTVLSTGEVEQWQRFPFLAGVEQYSGLLPFEAASYLIGGNEIPATSMNARINEQALVKMEENQWQNSSKQPFLGISENNNNNEYCSGNMWTDLL